jgi:exodeoxyribonuclease V alpha subunit
MELNGTIVDAKYFYNQREINSENEIKLKNTIYAILKIIDNGTEKIIKGNCIVVPKTGYYLMATELVKIDNKYNKNTFSTDNIILITLPKEQPHIKNFLLKFKRRYGITDLNKNDTYDILIKGVHGENFKKFLIDEGINDVNNISFILEYLKKVFNISIQKSDLHKLENYLVKYFVKFTNFIKKNKINKIVLMCVGIVSIDKLYNIIIEQKLNKKLLYKIEILDRLIDNENEGNSCIGFDELFKLIVRNEKNYDKNAVVLLLEKYINKLIKGHFIHKYNNHLYMFETWNIENNLAQSLIRIINSTPAKYNINIQDKGTLITEQINAINDTFNNSISILTGGPGFGKTTCITVLFKYCKLNNINIYILAPTGKAVARIKEEKDLDGYEGIMTIHRFLNIKQVINNGLIIIDEMSMVSNRLLRDLFEKLKDNGYNYLLIGDVDQIPSIEIGNVLQSLINSDRIKTHILTRSFRCSIENDLYYAITDIKNGKKPDNKLIKFKYIETDDINKILNSTLNDILSGTNFNDIMTITPTHRNINLFSEEIRKKVLKISLIDKSKFLEGDYIMLYENLYNINETYDIICEDTDELFNGMTGKIRTISVNENKINYEIVFSGGMTKQISAVFIENEIDKIKSSYVNTIHRCQGSENKIVIVILTQYDNHMINRNLLYTAVSRAKEMCYVISNKYIFENALNKKYVRISQLDRLVNTVAMV